MKKAFAPYCEALCYLTGIKSYVHFLREIFPRLPGLTFSWTSQVMHYFVLQDDNVENFAIITIILKMVVIFD